MNNEPDDPAKKLLDRLATWGNAFGVVAGPILLFAGIVASHRPMIVLGLIVIAAALLNSWMRRSSSDIGVDLIEREPSTTGQEETSASTGTGQITVRRRKGTAIIGGQYEVFVDGKTVANLDSGTAVTLDVRSGEHSVQVRTKNYASASLATEVAANGHTTIEVWGSMRRIRYAAHAPERAIAIRRTTR